MVGFLRRWLKLSTSRSADQSRTRLIKPAVDQLEPRELQTIIAGRSALTVHPGLLPSTGRYVPIHVYGAIATTNKVAPKAFFEVTDEYRRDEPHGTVKLTEVPAKYGFNRFAFDFTIYLQAQRSTNTPDGRHYNIFVGAKDFDTTDGRTASVYVPKVYPAGPPPIGRQIKLGG